MAVPESASDMLSYGTAAFVYSVSENILSDLMNVYSAKDAYTIMTIASLHILKPSTPANRTPQQV
ncbi:MAG: hypothetical protein LUG93_10115 [Lachnospiraceae bacterium]|nr:hypothetical protein [Lachnospiraceae bacterium]